AHWLTETLAGDQSQQPHDDTGDPEDENDAYRNQDPAVERDSRGAMIYQRFWQAIFDPRRLQARSESRNTQESASGKKPNLLRTPLYTLQHNWQSVGSASCDSHTLAVRFSRVLGPSFRRSIQFIQIDVEPTIHDKFQLACQLLTVLRHLSTVQVFGCLDEILT